MKTPKEWLYLEGGNIYTPEELNHIKVELDKIKDKINTQLTGFQISELYRGFFDDSPDSQEGCYVMLSKDGKYCRLYWANDWKKFNNEFEESVRRVIKHGDKRCYHDKSWYENSSLDILTGRR